MHTLYISPLKALAVDIERNLARPVAEMDLPVRIETRTGDTPQVKRQRQRTDPPDILLTTPEQVALLIANPEAERLFRDLRYVIFDELHSLVTSKRGHLLALGLARLRKLAPDLRTIGLSATVAVPEELQAWLVAQEGERDAAFGADRRRREEPSRKSRSCSRRNGCPGPGTPRATPFPTSIPRSASTGRPCSSSTRARRRNSSSRNCGG